MPSSQRFFVDAIQRFCAARGIVVDVRADGWLIVMQHGPRRHFAWGYDLGLNSAIAHRIANDKSATAEVLALAAVPSVPHSFFLSPKLSGDIARGPSWGTMLDLLEKHRGGLVLKPNEGTSGQSVFRVTTEAALELAANRIFASAANLAISPYVEIEDEVRVILIDDVAHVVYSKLRRSVTGDGKHSLIELALATLPAEGRAAALTGIIEDLDRTALEAIVPPGERRYLNWRHNLERGAAPVLLDDGEVRSMCVALATDAARAIGIRFASIDVIRVGAHWTVLEVNSGVMMEAFGRFHPDLVYATYSAALDKVFD